MPATSCGSWGDGRHLGLKSLHYTYQEGEGGIAQALGLVKHLTEKSSLAVMLGDNIFQKSIKPFVDAFRKQSEEAMIVLKRVSHPERFGVAEFNGRRLIRIREKPTRPKSDAAVTGVYFYDPSVFQIIKKLKPSRRGELEITDVNNFYIERNQMRHAEARGWWTDCGTFESLYRASCYVEKLRKRPK